MILFNYLFSRSLGVFVLDVPREYQTLIVFRALIGFLGLQGMWGSLKYMPVGLASTIIFTMPVWTVIIAYFLLKESITRYDILTLVAAFTGVILINNPFEP